MVCFWQPLPLDPGLFGLQHPVDEIPASSRQINRCARAPHRIYLQFGLAVDDFLIGFDGHGGLFKAFVNERHLIK